MSEKEIREKVLKMLDIKINEIFYDMQTELGIESGDIFPGDAFDLDELQEKVSDLITKVLLYESTGIFSDEEE